MAFQPLSHMTEISKYGSINKAARRLNLSQSLGRKGGVTA